MTRRVKPCLALAGAAVFSAACAPVVWMGAHRQGVFEELPDSVEVRRIDGRDMPRAELESVVDDHRILARLHARLPSGDGRDRALDEQLVKAEEMARTAGADALLYLDDPTVVAAIMQDARYAGPPGATVIYVMRSRGRP